MAGTVEVTELGVPTLTRPRGREAGARLRVSWPENDILLVLDGATMLSLSFLDGLVLELHERGDLERLTFVTRDARTQGKLARIAGLHRDMPLFWQAAISAPRQRVAPATIEAETPILETEKAVGE